jgi:flagellar biosynthesis/type III secretory pathway chaperone
MDYILNRLLRMLKEETSLYQSLLLVLRKEIKVVVEAELEALEEIAKDKEGLLRELGKLEAQRLSLMTQLAASLACPLPELTLKKLAELIDDPYASRLKDCASNLTAVLRKIQQTNNNNKSLLKHSIDLVQGLLSLLLNLTTGHHVYHSSGELQNDTLNGRIISGEI